VIVALSGIDGSGKSTLSAAVAGELSRRGHPALVGRPRYRANQIVKQYCKRQFGSEQSYVSNLDADFYLGTLALDWMEWWLELGDTVADQCVCCDRYTIDVLSQALHYGADTQVLEHLLAPIPTPTFSFLLEIAPRNALSRLEARVSPPRHELENLDALTRLEAAYEVAASRFDWPFIRLDAERPADELVDEIILHVVGAS
jgi:thymidylate kinase